MLLHLSDHGAAFLTTPLPPPPTMLYMPCACVAAAYGRVCVRACVLTVLAHDFAWLQTLSRSLGPQSP